ncbi:MAG: hypothetical protein ACRDTD_22030, partial [Pseudonocardiaceae bacterium]
MSIVAAQMLEGMPEPADLRRTEVDGQTVITVGARVIACFDTTDLGMRNITVQTLTETLRFTGRRVGQVMGLTPEYVSELRGRARREGSAGLVSTRGRPAKLRSAEVDKALAWREQGLSAVAIGRRLGVADTTVSRALAPRGTPAAAGPDSGDPAPTLEPVDQPEPAPEQAEQAPEQAEQGKSSSGGSGSGAQPVVTSGRLEQDVVTSRYAGAMLLHAFYDRIAAQRVFASLTHPADARFDDVALLTATTCAFALGVSSMEATKHLIRTQVGPLAGLDRLPALRTLRPRLAALAQGCDPLE